MASGNVNIDAAVKGRGRTRAMRSSLDSITVNEDGGAILKVEEGLSRRKKRYYSLRCHCRYPMYLYLSITHISE